jgi:TRAP-type transport system periplasmic protein
MKKFALRLSTVFSFISFLVILAPSGQLAAQTVTLRYSNLFPPVHKLSILIDQYCKDVEEQTQGKVKIQHYPGSTLTRPTDTYDGVLRGIADIGLSFCSYTMGRFPLTEVLDLPLGYKSAVMGAKLANAYFKKMKPAEFDGVKVLLMFTSPPHYFFTNKPVHTVEDLKGLKVRSSGTSAKVVKALGGAPVAMPMNEAYDALRKGVADAIICPFEALHGWKLVEVIQDGTVHDAAYVNVAYVAMNKAKWNKLPPDVQQVFEKINAEYITKFGELFDDLDQLGRNLFKEKRGDYITLTEEENARWTAMLQPVLDEYVKEKEAMGLPAKEALEFCIDYLKKNQI